MQFVGRFTGGLFSLDIAMDKCMLVVSCLY